MADLSVPANATPRSRVDTAHRSLVSFGLKPQVRTCKKYGSTCSTTVLSALLNAIALIAHFAVQVPKQMRKDRLRHVAVGFLIFVTTAQPLTCSGFLLGAAAEASIPPSKNFPNFNQTGARTLFQLPPPALSQQTATCTLAVDVNGSDESTSCSTAAPCRSFGRAATVVGGSTLPVSSSCPLGATSLVVTVRAGIYNPNSTSFALGFPFASTAFVLNPDAVIDCGGIGFALQFVAVPNLSVSGGVWQNCVNSALKFYSTNVTQLSEAVFLSNSASIGGGGAVYVDQSSMLLFANNLLFIGNRVTAGSCEGIVTGGALAVLNPQQPSIVLQNCVFFNNSATGVGPSCSAKGGAGFISSIAISMYNVSLSRNIASSQVAAYGGGLFLNAGNSVAADNLTASFCSAILSLSPAIPSLQTLLNAGGGALYLSFAAGSPTTTLQNMHIVGNTAAARTGGDSSASIAAKIAGGGVYLDLSQVPDVADAVIEVENSFIANNTVEVDCSLDMSGLAAVNLGGSAMYLEAVQFQMHRSVIMHNCLLLGSVRGQSNNHGGAVYLDLAQANSVVSVSDSAFLDNLVSINVLVALSSNQNGGAGLSISLTSELNLSLVRANFSRNLFRCYGLHAIEANENGGGAVYVNYASVLNALVQNCLFAYNGAVTASSSTAHGLNLNGGAGVYIVGNDVTANITDDSVFVGNYVNVDRATCSLYFNQNGGAGIYVSVDGTATLYASDSMFANNCVSANSNMAVSNISMFLFGGNQNGGAAIYVASNGHANTAFNRIYVLGNIVQAKSALSEGTATNCGNNNGGAIYVFAQNSSATASFSNTHFANNLLSADGSYSTTGLGNNNGGVAAYIVGAVGATVTVYNSSMRNNSLNSPLTTATVAGNNNGGALYLTAGGPVFVSITGGEFANNTVRTDGNTAGTLNANGGAAVYAFSRTQITFGITNVTVKDNFVVASNAAVLNANGTGNFNGGAVYVFSGQDASCIVQGSTLSNNYVDASNAYTSAPIGNNNGGAALFAITYFASSVYVANTLVAGNKVYADNSTSLAFGTNASNANGGAIYALSVNAVVQFNATASKFVGNALFIDTSSAVMLNQNGGGALFLNAETTATASIFSSVFASNVVSVQSSITTWSGNDTANCNGGAACYVATDSAQINLAELQVESNQLLLGNNSAATNQNGAGGVYIHAATDILLVISGGQYLNNSVAAEGESAITSQSGGGAVYALSSDPGARVTATLNDTQMFGNWVRVTASPQLQSTQTGGGAMYFNTQSSSVSLHRSTLRENLVYVRGVSSNGDCVDGGGAFYTNCQFNCLVQISASHLRNNSVQIFSLIAGTVTSGGGAVFAYSGNQLGSNQLQSFSAEYSENSVYLHDVTSRSNAVIGGGAVQVYGQAVSRGVFNGDSFLANNVTGSYLAVSKSLASLYIGGGAVLALSSGSRSSVHLSGSTVFQCLVSVSVARSPLGNVYVGGGGVLSIGAEEATLHTVGGEMSRNSVASSNLLSTVGQVSSGGGAAMVWTLNTDQSDSINVTTVFTNFTGNLVETVSAVGETVRSGGGAIFISSEYAQLTIAINNCRFVNNTAMSSSCGNSGTITTHLGGGALLLFDSRPCASKVCAEVSETSFIGNIATSHLSAQGQVISGGGGIYAILASTLTVQSSTFVSNWVGAEDDGGGILSAEGPLTMTNTTLSYNRASSGGALKSTGTINAINMVVDHNTAGLGGGLFLSGRNNIWQNSLLTRNYATYYAGAVYAALECSVQFVNAVIDSSSAQAGGAIVAADEAKINLTQCSVIDNDSRISDGGAILTLIRSAVSISSCGFLSNAASSGRGGAIAAMDFSTVVVTGSTFDHSSAALQGGWLFAADSAIVSLTASRVIWASTTMFSGGAMFVQASARVTLANSTFLWCSSRASGGVLFMEENSTVNMESVNMTNNSAQNGGAVYATGEAALSLSNSTCDSNFGRIQGGAVYLATTTPLVLSGTNVFSDNWSSQGGAIYIAKLSSDSLIAIANWSARFVNNYATCKTGSSACGGGGAIYWNLNEMDPSLLGDARNLSRQLQRNIATAVASLYGSSVASSWFGLQAVPSPFTFARPGDTITIRVEPVDLFGNVISSLNQQLVSVSCNPPGSCVTTGLVPLSNGNATFTTAIKGQPREDVTVTLSVVESTRASQSAHFSVFMQNCLLGYGLDKSECQACPSGTATANPQRPCQSASCLPSDGVLQGQTRLCLGGNLVLVAPNYWPLIDSNLGNFSVHRCPFDFCDRNTSIINVQFELDGWGYVFDKTTWCNEDSHRDPNSVLCGGCKAGYAEWNHQCLECTNWYNGDVLAFTCFVMVCIVLVQHLFGQTITGRTAFTNMVFIYQISSLSVYPRKFETFIDAFDLQWPGTAVMPMFNNMNERCPFQITVVAEMVLSFTMPIVYIVVLICLYGIHLLVGFALTRGVVVRRNPRIGQIGNRIYHWASGDHYIPTVIVMGINSYEALLSSARAVITKAPGWDSGLIFEYPTAGNQGAWEIAGYAVIVILCLLPVLAAIVLIYFSRTGRLSHLEGRFGQYFLEYKEKYCFWESVLLLRRAALLGLFVAFRSGRYENESQTSIIALLLTLLLFVCLQLAVRPYKHDIANLMEVFTLCTTAVLIGVLSIVLPDESTTETISQVTVILCGVVLHAPVLIPLIRRVLAWGRGRLAERQMRQRLDSATAAMGDNPVWEMQMKLLRSASESRSTYSEAESSQL